jgi:bacterioferritin-associated ferredoxin
MIICVCRRVSDKTLVRHAQAGASFDDIQFDLGVATQCGKCESCARAVVAQCHTQRPVAFMHGTSPADQPSHWAVPTAV